MANIKKGTVMVFNHNYIGDDKTLGEILIKSFVAVLAERAELPETMIFYNSAVKLMVEEGQVLDDLKTLEKNGVEILGCGTCLGHYEMKEKIGVGKVSNMYDIVDKQMNAASVLYPC